MEQDWIIDADSEDSNALSNRHTALTLWDILRRDLRNGTLESELSPDDDTVLLLAQSLDRHLHRVPRGENNLFVVCWIKAQPLGRSGIRMGPCVDFFRKDDFLQCFRTIPCYDAVALRDLPRKDYYDVLALALQKTSIKPITLGTHTLRTHLLNAAVPKSTAENKYGSIVKWVLKAYFTHALREKWEFEHPFIRQSSAENDELSAAEMEKMIREVYVFNKISLYQELSLIHAEFSTQI